MESIIEKLYRYEGYDTYSLENPYEYKIVKETRCGWWVTCFCFPTVKPRWVSKSGKKRYAYPTKEEALTNYIARKRSQIQHCKNNIAQAEDGLRLAGVDLKPRRIKLC